jgi:quinol monooxygenase YgiN
MAITEIALLHLLPTTTIDDGLRSKLVNAKVVMEKFTGRRFYYLQQMEDADCIYVIGEWDSLDQHMNHFIPSEANQALLRDLGPYLTVDWLLHIDAPHAVLPIPKTKVENEGKEPHVVGIVRHFIRDGEKDEFKETFEENKHHLQEYVTEGKIGGGWRVDPEEGKDEFVLWHPWTEVDQHIKFAGTEGFQKYSKIREHINGAEIKHARLFEV